MKNRLVFLTTLFTLVFAISLTSCKKKNDDDITNTDNQNKDTTDVDTVTDFTSLYDVIIQADSFNYLVEAVGKAGLVETLKQETGTYTVFLPTDYAFEVFMDYYGYRSVDEIPEEVLLYHLIGDKVVNSSGFGGYQTTMSDCNGMLSLYISATDSLNGEAAILQKDVEADNGVIHIIDAVLELPSIYTFIKADAELSLYYAGVLHYSDGYFDLGPDDVLSNNDYGPYTIFAPVNSGVEDMFEYFSNSNFTINNWSDFSSSYDGVSNVVLNHVTDTSVVKSQISSSTVLIGDFEGFIYGVRLFFNVETDITITGEELGDGIDFVNSANYLTGDIKACNGVLHKVDAVFYDHYSQEEEIIFDQELFQAF